MNRRLPTCVLTVVLVCVLVSACGRTNSPVETADAASSPAPKLRGNVSTTATGPAGQTTSSTAPWAVIPMWPLTGKLLGDMNQTNRPAIVVKIDNAPDARPHTGLNQADIVYELKVEGITRFAAIYHSEDADPVGPVRSARSSDLNIVSNLNKPYLLWSGGNPGVTNEIRHAESLNFVVDISDEKMPKNYFRDNSRTAPHNLYSHMSTVRESMSLLSGYQPPPLFAYRNTDEPLPPTAIDTQGMVVNFGGGVQVNYVWDAERDGWDRFQVDERHPRGRDAFVDSDGRQVAPQNVVIMFTQYGVSEVDARSPKAYTVGEGDAVVLTAGKAFNAHWKRDSPVTAPVLTDSGGNQIGLTPGKTWIALPEVGTPGVLPMDPVEAQALLAQRA